MSVLVNLSLTPALLLRFPEFFSGAPLSCCCCARKNEGEKAPAQKDQSCMRMPVVPPALAQLDVWAGLAKLTTRFKYALTVSLLALLVAPFAYRLSSFEISQSLRNIMPREMESAETYYELQDVFGPAATNAAKLIGIATSSAQGAELTPAFFASAAAAVSALLAVSAPNELTAAAVSGLAWGGAPANATSTAAALASVAACPATSVTACRAACSAQACSLQLSSASSLSADAHAMLLSVNLGVDRTSKDGVAWVHAARAALAAANAANGDATWQLLVDPSSDSIQYIYDRLGTLVGVTAAVVFVILLVSFRSVANAARTVVSLTAMEVCVWGAAIAIYCQGELNPGGVLHTFDNKTGLFWLMPLLAFSLTTGLGAPLSLCHQRSLRRSPSATSPTRRQVAAGKLTALANATAQAWTTTSFSSPPSSRSASPAGPTPTPSRWACNAAAGSSPGRAPSWLLRTAASCSPRSRC
jgi:hypothetical protein